MTDRQTTLRLRPSDFSPDAGWRLVRWTLDTGADEFNFTCMLGPSPTGRLCTSAEAMLSAFSIGRAQRPALSRRINEGLRETQLWRLNDESFAVLQKLLPEGLFTDRQGSNDGWIEDLTIYSEGRVRLGVITHEHEAVLELTDRERDHLRGVAILP